MQESKVSVSSLEIIFAMLSDHSNISELPFNYSDIGEIFR